MSYKKEQVTRSIYYRTVFFITIFGIVAYVVAYNTIEEAAVRENPFETTATITSLKKCSKNGRCIYYEYE